MPEHHTREEQNEAIEAANMLYERDGYLTSKTLLKELETRTGKPASYWHTIELFNAIKRARDGTRRNVERYKLTKEHEGLILAAAEVIASRQAVPKISAEDIRQFFRNMDEEHKPANPAAITKASSEKINAILKAAGWTQYRTGGYITSIPPARNADDMETTALRIIEAAEDPQSGIAEKLHDIRFKHEYRDATPEELQAAILSGFMDGDPHASTRKAETLTNRRAKRTARKNHRPEPSRLNILNRITERDLNTGEPETAGSKEARHQAYRDLKATREAAGKEPALIEGALYIINSTEAENIADRIREKARKNRQPRTRKYKFEPTAREAAARNRGTAEATGNRTETKTTTKTNEE